MELIDKKDLPFLPYNYKNLLKIELEEDNIDVRSYVEVKDYMTTEHMLNFYYGKPVTKYFKEDEFQK